MVFVFPRACQTFLIFYVKSEQLCLLMRCGIFYWLVIISVLLICFRALKTFNSHQGTYATENTLRGTVLFEKVYYSRENIPLAESLLHFLEKKSGWLQGNLCFLLAHYDQPKKRTGADKGTLKRVNSGGYCGASHLIYSYTSGLWQTII